MSEEIPKGVSFSRASLGGDFWANTYGQVPENAARRMTTLKPGENLMMETNSCTPGRLEVGVSSHSVLFCALDFNVIRARYWSRVIPPPRTRCEHGGVTEKEAHKTYQYRCRTKEERGARSFFLNHMGLELRLRYTPCFGVARTD